MIKVINIISIINGSLLLVKKRDFWILPGGKVEGCESFTKCLMRELRQELPESILTGKIYYFDTFFGDSPNGKPKEVVCYLGNIIGDISPAAEISDAAWFSRDDVFFYPLSDITKNIVQKLITQNIF